MTVKKVNLPLNMGEGYEVSGWQIPGLMQDQPWMFRARISENSTAIYAFAFNEADDLLQIIIDEREGGIDPRYVEQFTGKGAIQRIAAFARSELLARAPTFESARKIA